MPRHPPGCATRLRRIAVVTVVALVMPVGWRAYARASCRTVLAKFQEIQRTHTRDDVHGLLGTPKQVFTGADVLAKRHWGTVVVGPE